MILTPTTKTLLMSLYFDRNYRDYIWSGKIYYGLLDELGNRFTIEDKYKHKRLTHYNEEELKNPSVQSKEKESKDFIKKHIEYQESEEDKEFITECIDDLNRVESELL